MSSKDLRSKKIRAFVLLTIGTEDVQGNVSERISNAAKTVVRVGNIRFATIQDGVDNVNPGGTVLVKPGAYSGNVDVGKAG